MNTDIQTSTSGVYERKSRKSKASSVPVFLVVWILLIAGGVLGTIWYTDKMREKMEQEVSLQTAQQISAMQKDYEAQMKQLQTNFTGEITKVQNKVDALNQLLEFTKDNASDKTDNSNKLYSQLSDVQKQLTELKKQLDVLK